MIKPVTRFASAIVFASAVAGAPAQQVIRGAGATFPQPLYDAWADRYASESGMRVTYQSIGSVAGVAAVARHDVDFGGSDVPLSEGERTRLGLIQFPVAIGGVVPIVNLRGIEPGRLKLTGQILGEIYLGRIRRWNDPALAALNPGLALPPENITVVHRSDASGTTFLWTQFLAQTHSDWKTTRAASTVVDWPVGVGGKGNEGVAALVQRTRASIGYVEFAFARRHRLAHASLRNREGAYVQPSHETFEAAALAAPWTRTGDLTQILTDAPGAASWPITGATFILVPASGGATVIVFFRWALEHGDLIARQLDYAPLPPTAASLVEALWRAQPRP